MGAAGRLLIYGELEDVLPLERFGEIAGITSSQVTRWKMLASGPAAWIVSTHLRPK
jgi:hypothetical protein